MTNTNFTTVDWTYAGQTFGITIDPGDVDELMKHIGEVREKFMRTEPVRQGPERHLGWCGADDRARRAFEKELGTYLGVGLLWYACSAPEPYGPRALQRMQRTNEGGSTIALDITKDDDTGWKLRWLLNAVEGTIQ